MPMFSALRHHYIVLFLLALLVLLTIEPVCNKSRNRHYYDNGIYNRFKLSAMRGIS